MQGTDSNYAKAAFLNAKLYVGGVNHDRVLAPDIPNADKKTRADPYIKQRKEQII